MDFIFLLKLVLVCALLFVCGSFCFDIVHYILHVFEKSRFRFLRWLGGFHTVHHDFLDRQMQIQRKYTYPNLILHVIPEYMTAVIGIGLLGFLFFGWLPAAIVIGIRTLMVIVYVLQKGEDFTHQAMNRISGKRSLFFVGAQYHALHHVYPYQYYSSFVNVFDLLFGTNCQIKDRRFLISQEASPFTQGLTQELKHHQALVESKDFISDMSSNKVSNLKELFSKTDVLILPLQKDSSRHLTQLISLLKEVGQTRLVPPELWVIDLDLADSTASNSQLSSDKDLTFRKLSSPRWLSPDASAKMNLFFIRRGVCTVPLHIATPITV